jgi:heparan-alpha-glucosaminide N-acetyltransferase
MTLHSPLSQDRSAEEPASDDLPRARTGRTGLARRVIARWHCPTPAPLDGVYVAAGDLAGGPRLQSVDALRGCVIALMVFVNSVPGMKGAPAWSQHLPSRVDGYTLTDLVFPWFLFLVGVSIPLSLGKHLDGGWSWASRWAAFTRILPRVLGLLVLGLIDVNEDRHNAAATGVSQALWFALTVTAAVVIWRVRPAEGSSLRQRLETAAQLLAAVVLVYLLVIWRGDTSGGGIGPLRTSWWGILGLIGWCYLVGSMAFLLARGNQTALIGICGLLICIALGGRHERFGLLAPLRHVLNVRELCGSLSAIVVAGSVAGLWLRRPSFTTVRTLAFFGVGLWLAGWFLRPLHGYHKISASEGWALVAAGQGALLLALFHGWLDVWRGGGGGGRIARWLGLVGCNALLAYLLPEWVGSWGKLVGIDLMPYWAQGGAAGLVNAVLLTLAVTAVAALATRTSFILKL